MCPGLTLSHCNLLANSHSLSIVVLVQWYIESSGRCHPPWNPRRQTSIFPQFAANPPGYTPPIPSIHTPPRDPQGGFSAPRGVEIRTRKTSGRLDEAAALSDHDSTGSQGRLTRWSVSPVAGAVFSFRQVVISVSIPSACVCETSGPGQT
jgi:hypothetical protein